LINDHNAVGFARSVAESVVGAEMVTDFEPKMWAEDFAYYSQIMPACFWMLGGRPHDLDSMPGLHNAKFAPDEQAMITGTSLLVESAISYLQ
jgi:metal-dependent amidase/aminoacylase/carboxypeptidase family protein